MSYWKTKRENLLRGTTLEKFIKKSPKKQSAFVGLMMEFDGRYKEEQRVSRWWNKALDSIQRMM